MTKEETKKIKRRFQGTVISDKMAKTVVVKVNRVKLHPKYHKRYVMSKNYKAHDEKNEYKTGDQVLIEECRPLSRGKRWRVISRVGESVLTERMEQEELGEVDKVDEVVTRVEKKQEIKGRADEAEKEIENKIESLGVEDAIEKEVMSEEETK